MQAFRIGKALLPPSKNHIFFQCTVSFSSFVFLGFILNRTAQMRPGDGVEELILTLLVSDYQLAVHETLCKFEPGS